MQSTQIHKDALETLGWNLEADEVYFSAAYTNLAIAESTLGRIAEGKLKFDEIQRDFYLEMHDRGDCVDGALDDIRPAEDYTEEAYRLCAQALASVHVFCVTALESHINCLAKQHLTGSALENFDKLSLEGKWMFLPRILGVPGFDVGHQPFQDFAEIIKYRNTLVHHKNRNGQSENIPVFEGRLGLTAMDARKSIEATAGMIKLLAEQLRHRKPVWIARRENTYFQIVIEPRRT